jgi:hypothetical protein
MSRLRVNTLASRTGTGNISVPTGNVLRGTDLGSVYAPGSVIQAFNSVSGPVRYTFASLTPQVIPGLSITFTPLFANSIILVQASVSGSQTHVNSYGVFRNGATTVSTAGQTNLNEPDMQVTQYLGTATTENIYQVPVMHFETAANTVSRTYAIYVTSGWSGTTYSTFVNNRNSNDMASFSYMTVMEIAQ